MAFFRSFRDLVATGFWTSKIGIDDLQFIGNVFVHEWNGCPDQVLKKLGLNKPRPIPPRGTDACRHSPLALHAARSAACLREPPRGEGRGRRIAEGDKR